MARPDDPLEFDENPTMGSRLLDILAGAAKGYSQGAGNSDIPEAAFARSFSGGYEGGKESRKRGRLAGALESFRTSPEYETLSDLEKTAFRANPGDFLKDRSSRKKEEGMLDEATTAEIFAALGRTAPAGARLSKAAGERLTALAGMKDRKSAAEQAAEDRAAIAKDRQEGIRSRDSDTRVQKFSKTVEDLGIPEAVTQFKALSQLMPKPGEDIHGVGVTDSLKPDLLAGKDARALRQVVAGVQNIKIKDRSGAAVTPPEFVRLAQEFGSGRLKTEDQFRQGIQTALNTYRERLRNAFAGVTPEVRGQYFQNQDIDDYLKTLDSYNFGGTSSPAAAAGSPPPAGGADAKGFVVGNQYRMKDGNMATYVGNGEFE